MPDSEGNFKGILVPELPWLKDNDVVQFVAGYRYVVDEDGTEQVSTKVAKLDKHPSTPEA